MHDGELTLYVRVPAAMKARLLLFLSHGFNVLCAMIGSTSLSLFVNWAEPFIEFIHRPLLSLLHQSSHP